MIRFVSNISLFNKLFVAFLCSLIYNALISSLLLQLRGPDGIDQKKCRHKFARYLLFVKESYLCGPLPEWWNW